MEVFSRGFGRRVIVSILRPACQTGRQQSPSFILRSRLTQASRSFQASAGLRAHKGPPHKGPPRKHSSAHPKASPPTISIQSRANLPTRDSGFSFADIMARRGPIILYEAPSHFWMKISSVATGLFCFGFASWTYADMSLYAERQKLPEFVSYGFLAVSIVITGMGMAYIMITANIVRMVRSLPVKQVPGLFAKDGIPTTAAARSKENAALLKSPLALEITMTRPLPLLPTFKMYVAPKEVVMPFLMQDMPVARGGKIMQMISKREAAAEKARKEASRLYTMQHLMTAPFRDFAKVMRHVVACLRRGLTREGFVKITVRDKKYKIDLVGGTVKDEGRTFDRLVTLRPDVLR